MDGLEHAQGQPHEHAFGDFGGVLLLELAGPVHGVVVPGGQLGQLDQVGNRGGVALVLNHGFSEGKRPSRSLRRRPRARR